MSSAPTFSSTSNSPRPRPSAKARAAATAAASSFGQIRNPDPRQLPEPHLRRRRCHRHLRLHAAARETPRALPANGRHTTSSCEGPRFKDGKLAKPLVVTVLHNGVVTQNHTALIGETPHKTRRRPTHAHPREGPAQASGTTATRCASATSGSASCTCLRQRTSAKARSSGISSLLKNPKHACHPERSAAMGEGGAARSRRIPWNDWRPPKLGNIGVGKEIARERHGILRLRSARLSASAALRMTSRLEVFQQAVRAVQKISQPRRRGVRQLWSAAIHRRF